MSLCNTLLNLEDRQVCYVECGLCANILLVSVPTSITMKVVTVRCGHCSCLLSVNMFHASFFPMHLLPSSLEEQNQEAPICSNEEVEVHPKDPNPKTSNTDIPVNLYSVYRKAITPPQPIVSKQRKYRLPTAYNHFIKEEILRLKAIDPNMNHKMAFSNAAKNWSLHPRILHKLDGEGCSYGEGDMGRNTAVGQGYLQNKNIFERKASRLGVCARPSFK
ncbi:hypothetical protein GIB67_017685 [Kingdonia uniflora]|uniref:Uncharacterized protein n=1 Tax=Kingdonia uniflora TaxID=39325 RepID=A0A7J7NA49_9MAGN|nr:hypothetical protein GIB67_017685 [Kingdonia uniflora]